MKGQEQQVKRASEQIGSEMKDDVQGKFRQATTALTKKGRTPKEALGLTDAMIEGIYGQAYRLYNTGKYQDAIQIFRLLIMVNGTDCKYAIGLAACFHMQKQFKEAASVYTVAGILDPDNPIPLYHVSDCYVQMGDYLSALIALETAVKRSSDKPEYSMLRERATLSIEALKKEVAKAKTA